MELTTVFLVTPEGEEQEFNFSHAESLLGMRNNGGWSLPDNSNFIFDKSNGLRIRADKRAYKQQKETSNNK